jgi:hypothetical protein
MARPEAVAAVLLDRFAVLDYYDRNDEHSWGSSLMRSFVAAIVAAIVIAVIGSVALNMVQKPAEVAFTTSGARI